MTYEAYEDSVYSGEPVELYEFQYEEGSSTYRYTSSNEDQTYQGYTYYAIAINRNTLEQSQDVARASLTITMPSSNNFVTQFIVEPPFVKIGFILRRFQAQDADDEVNSIWVGRVINVEQKEGLTEIRCESSYSSLKRPTLRRLYQASCAHVLYQSVCAIDKSSFETTGTLTDISGNTITSALFATQADGYFAGGFIEYTSSSIVVRRFIINHEGSVATLSLPLYSVSTGATISAYPGCDHTMSTCLNKFSNLDNFGGQPWIPTKNPLSGVPIF
jgi:uncharacterized phage protein (TIGR02218 family)